MTLSSVRMSLAVRRAAFVVVLGSLFSVQAACAQSGSLNRAIAARGRLLELPTVYEPVAGDPRSHRASGLAKVMCSAVFVTGLDPEFALANVGYFTGGDATARKEFGQPVVDRGSREVHVQVPGGPRRTARYLGSQGCVSLPVGDTGVRFAPITVKSGLSDPTTVDWPMGDRVGDAILESEVSGSKLRQAVDAAFGPQALTAAFVVTWRGRIIAERYGEGITPQTPLESWSMGKSLTATLMGVLIQQGVYDLWQEAPIPEWSMDDPRRRIRIADLLRMSSGLRIISPNDPDFKSDGPYPDHLFLYTGTVNAAHFAATRPQQWPPNTVGRYRNTDPVLVNYLIRLAIEQRGENHLAFPQRALFDRLGIRTMVLETDLWGNFLTQGYELGTARDWARLGNLYLQDGVWNGQRILTHEFVEFVRTPAPAWQADGNPVYGGFFWLNSDRFLTAPPDSYYMDGAGGQNTIIIPSHELVVVRLGHARGEAQGRLALNRALALLLDAVPSSK